MTAIIFAGPSIHGLEVPARPDLIFRPPAAQGDVFRATLMRPKAIGLIDGYFDGVPSVWHKEVIWALSQGIIVYGSASMGALRAAELDCFGMLGIGRIYQWYRDEDLEDDDEVALLHGPPETAFLPLSEPMVNIRATCDAAVDAGVISRATSDLIVECAKAIHYRDRTLDAITAAVSERCAPEMEIEAFAHWLPAGRVDQKRRDAEALIAEIVAALEHPPAVKCNFDFEWTDLWDRASQEWTMSASPSAALQGASDRAVLDELRLQPQRFAEIRLQALQREILLREADRRRVIPSRSDITSVMRDLRERLRLMRKLDLDAWAARNDLAPEDVEALMNEEARIKAITSLLPGSIERHILAVLRLCGEYESVASRARAKQLFLERSGLSPNDLPEMSPPLLVSNFFSRRGQPVPDDLDTFLAWMGIRSRQAFYNLVAAEYLYLSYLHEEDAGASKPIATESEP